MTKNKKDLIYLGGGVLVLILMGYSSDSPRVIHGAYGGAILITLLFVFVKIAEKLKRK